MFISPQNLKHLSRYFSRTRRKKRLFFSPVSPIYYYLQLIDKTEAVVKVTATATATATATVTPLPLPLPLPSIYRSYFMYRNMLQIQT